MKGKGSKIFVYILLGLLILGLAGFGIGSFGGSVRSIGKVGETEISINEYATALQAELRGLSQQSGRSVSLRELQTVGMDRQVLSQVVTTAALRNESARLGLSVGDEIVAEEIRKIPAFAGVDGSFDRQNYEFTLEQANLSPSEFEDTMRADTATSILQAAVAGGISAPDTFADTLFNYLAERRSFRWARLSLNDVSQEIPAPSPEDLAAVYSENPDALTQPETRKITYALLSPEMMLDTIDIPEEDLRKTYDDNISEYVQPERRILYRLVFADQSEAQAALSALESGETDFETLAADRGLSLDDIALGEVAREDLGNSLSEPIFALEDTGLVGPLDTDLGPALFRVAGLLNAQETPFEDVRDELFTTAAMDRAIRAVAAEIEPIDDLLAGGATLQELADETPMQLAEIELTAETEEGIAGYQAFREAALAAQPDDFPEIIELDDGSVAALQIDELIAAHVPPIEEVEAQVTQLWTQQQQMAGLRQQAEQTLSVLNGGYNMAALGLGPTEETALTRDAFIDGTPPALLAEAFLLQAPGDRALVDGNEEIYLVELLQVQGPDLDNPEATTLRDVLAQQAGQSMTAELFTAYTNAVQASAGLQLDQAAINAVHAQFP